jgi:NAD(P)-dependent dehydrogenase (short-subunit alcohol dehydrogenase family)
LIAIRGAGSAIARELDGLLPPGEEVRRIERGEGMPLDAQRYLFCQGLMRPKTLTEQTPAEIAESWLVNFAFVARACDRILEANELARICVLGSESGVAWSHDGAYAAAKAALHRYVETKRLGERQQLVGIAPGIIWDCGMTTRRRDQQRLKELADAHPKVRFLFAVEVARLAHFLLYVDEGYLTGTVIRMHGGPR